MTPSSPSIALPARLSSPGLSAEYALAHPQRTRCGTVVDTAVGLIASGCSAFIRASSVEGGRAGGARGVLGVYRARSFGEGDAITLRRGRLRRDYPGQ